MAWKKTPDGGFYMNDTQVNIDYEANTVSIIGDGGGGEAGDYLTLDGGLMNADATISATDELTIEAADSNESATIGITPQGVTLVHNTNDTADARIRVIENNIELESDGLVVGFDPTGVDFGGGVITNVASIGGTSAGEIAFENTLDMNNHQIKAIADPTEAQDAATKNYVDTNFLTTAKLPSASASAKGVVNQGVYVADATGADDIVTQFNALLASLKDAGVIATV